MKHIALVLALVAASAPAFAQSKTTGAIRGTVTEKPSKEKAVGVTVVVTSPALQGEQVAITDETGVFTVGSLPPGTYEITYYYADATTKHANVVVKVGAVTTVADSIKVQPGKGDIVAIEGTPFEPFTITGPGFTLTRAEDLSITVQRKGKDAVKATLTPEGDGVIFTDGKKAIATYSSDEDRWEIKVDGAVVATISKERALQIVGRKKSLSFNKKGVLVGTAAKIKVTPARLRREVEPLLVMTALLRDQL